MLMPVCKLRFWRDCAPATMASKNLTTASTLNAMPKAPARLSSVPIQSFVLVCACLVWSASFCRSAGTVSPIAWYFAMASVRVALSFVCSVVVSAVTPPTLSIATTSSLACWISARPLNLSTMLFNFTPTVSAPLPKSASATSAAWMADRNVEKSATKLALTPT